ncbi:protein FAM110D [Rhinophrynus dorsalis]
MTSVSSFLHRNTGGVTASERLEADKAKYVKTPEVIKRRQNPAINASLTPDISRKLLLPHCNHKPQNKQSFSSSPIMQQRTLTQHTECEPQTEHSYCTIPTSAMSQKTLSQHQSLKQRVLVPSTSHLSAKTVRPVQSHSSSEPQSDHTHIVRHTLSTPEKLVKSHQLSQGEPAPTSPLASPQSLRRVSGKRLHRPDSLIIYRQKRDLTLTEKENNGGSEGLVFRLLQRTPLLKRRIPLAQNHPQPCSGVIPVSPVVQRRTEEPSACQDSFSGVSHTQDIVPEEQASLPPSYAQQFFESCGLQGSLLNLLDNLYQLSTVTPLGSLESIDRVSVKGGVLLQEEEREEKTPVSVIERNARVIKWIYSCQHAWAINRYEGRQISRESTV